MSIIPRICLKYLWIPRACINTSDRFEGFFYPNLIDLSILFLSMHNHEVRCFWLSLNHCTCIYIPLSLLIGISSFGFILFLKLNIYSLTHIYMIFVIYNIELFQCAQWFPPLTLFIIPISFFQLSPVYCFLSLDLKPYSKDKVILFC